MVSIWYIGDVVPTQLLLRLDGKPEEALNDLMRRKRYKTKSEAIRAAVIELAGREHNVEEGLKLLQKIQAVAQKKNRSFKEVTAALDDLENE